MVANDSRASSHLEYVHVFALRVRGKVREQKQKHICILKLPIALSHHQLRHFSPHDLLISRGNEDLGH